MILILLLIFIILLLIITYNKKEYFNGAYMSIVDPYSLYLHKDISAKADWWNYIHNRKLYYYRDYVNMSNKE